MRPSFTEWSALAAKGLAEPEKRADAIAGAEGCQGRAVALPLWRGGGGPLSDTGGLAYRLSKCWHNLERPDGGMEPEKLAGRMEDVESAPSILTFTTEQQTVASCRKRFAAILSDRLANHDGRGHPDGLLTRLVHWNAPECTPSRSQIWHNGQCDQERMCRKWRK
jgi:hypothetical protein